MFKCVGVFFPFLTECVTDQFIEALTDLDNATGIDVWCQKPKENEQYDDAGQKGKKKILKAS